MDRNLRNFLYAADCLNFTEASKMAGVSQPALTKSIQKLEDQYGAPLFERMARGVILTEAGKMLLRRARAIANELEYARYEIEMHKQGESGATLRIGSGQFWASGILPQFTTTLQNEFPGLRIHVRSGYGEDLIEALNNRELDIVVCNAQFYPDNDAVTVIPLNTVDLVVVAHPEHRIHDDQPKTHAELTKYSWTDVRRNMGPDGLAGAYAVTTPAMADITLSTNSLNFGLTHTTTSNNLMLIPRPAVSLAKLHGLKVVALPFVARKFPSAIFQLKSANRMKECRRLRQMLVEWGNSLPTSGSKNHEIAV